MKVYLIECTDKDKNGKTITVVSHGVDENLKNVILPCEPVHTFNPKFDSNGAYIEVED